MLWFYYTPRGAKKRSKTVKRLTFFEPNDIIISNNSKSKGIGEKMKNKEVLVLFKTHLDIGFTDFSKNIVKKYLTESIPKAIKVGNALKGTDTPFVWTLGAWMVNEALKNDKDGTVDKAIRDGIIVWHALPFTTHTELMSPKLFEEGLKISKKLDERYGKKTIASKMTDVPGHTKGMIPIMKKYGVSFLHIGVNPATPLPPVPYIFNWKCGDDSIVVMYQKDYGSCEEFDDFVIYFAHTGDNLGPQSAKEVEDIYAHIKSEFPGYTVRAATLEDVAERVLKMKDLPVLDKEIGDTWIHGAGTDPLKVSRYRNALRHIENQDLDKIDITDTLLVVPEHTWGMDIKKFLNNDRDYTHRQMEKLVDTPEYKNVEASWKEQRQYVFDAEKKLGITPFEVCAPDLSGTQRVENAPELPIEISWQLFDNSDYERYKKTYMRLIIDWSIWDFTKIGLFEYKGGIFTAKMVAAYSADGKILYEYRFDKEAEEEYGLPYFIVEKSGEEICLKWFGKKASRLPQAFWLKLLGQNEDWQINKMGQWIDPDDIVGSPLICAVDKGVRNKDVEIEPLDSCLVAPYGRKLLHYNIEKTEKDMYFNLYNNIWNTNFPMWYSDDAMFRFKVTKR